jgi:hypothetical protein
MEHESDMRRWSASSFYSPSRYVIPLPCLNKRGIRAMRSCFLKSTHTPARYKERERGGGGARWRWWEHDGSEFWHGMGCYHCVSVCDSISCTPRCIGSHCMTACTWTPGDTDTDMHAGRDHPFRSVIKYINIYTYIHMHARSYRPEWRRGSELMGCWITVKILSIDPSASRQAWRHSME